MTLVMLGAILVDRPALSMRNLALAALIVLAREPESAARPELPDVLRRRRRADRAGAAHRWPPHRTRGAARPCGAGVPGLRCAASSGSSPTTLVASSRRRRSAAYHFQTLNPLGLVGNALALPLVSIVVMPAAVLGVVALPLRPRRPVWRVMGVAVEKVLDVSAFVSGLDGATVLIPALGGGALAALSLRAPRGDAAGLAPAPRWRSCRRRSGSSSRRVRCATTPSSIGTDCGAAIRAGGRPARSSSASRRLRRRAMAAGRRRPPRAQTMRALRDGRALRPRRLRRHRDGGRPLRRLRAGRRPPSRRIAAAPPRRLAARGARRPARPRSCSTAAHSATRRRRPCASTSDLRSAVDAAGRGGARRPRTERIEPPAQNAADLCPRRRTARRATGRPSIDRVRDAADPTGRPGSPASVAANQTDELALDLAPGPARGRGSRRPGSRPRARSTSRAGASASASPPRRRSARR